MGQGTGQDRLTHRRPEMAGSDVVQARRGQEAYASQFETFSNGPGAGAPEWLRQLRAEGFARFEASGFPTTRHEDWKYTNVAPIARGRYIPAWECTGAVLSEADVEELIVSRPGWRSLVFLNGIFNEQLSSDVPGPDGVIVSSLSKALESSPELVRQHLGRYADLDSNGFIGLNSAFIDEGAFVHIAPGAQLENPIQLIFVTSADEAVVSYPRNLVILEPGSKATTIESYVGAGSEPSFTNAVTEVVVGEGARLNHYKVQREGSETFHVGTTQIHQGRESQVSTFSLDVGGKLGRNDLNVDFQGEAGECSLNGLFVTSEGQHIDNHTSVDHASSYTRSRQLYKGILDGRSKAVFNGKVVARQGTHQVDAHQTNRNLLLAPRAEVSTKPQLEIFADDLKCSHGATVGQLDDEAIFYLNSRGVSVEDARRFLVRGFAQEVIDTIEVEEIKELIGNVVAEKLGAENG